MIEQVIGIKEELGILKVLNLSLSHRLSPPLGWVRRRLLPKKELNLNMW